MNILAIDLGKFNSMCCFYETDTQKYRFQAAATTRGYLKAVFKNHKIDLVVMEACGPSGWINDLCQELGLKTLICSTNDEAWRWKNVKRKTDKDDSLKLARMAMMRQLTPVHVPSHTVREHRTLIKYRKKLVGRITQIKNSIRGLFVCRGIEIDKGQPAWRTGRELINSHRRPLVECSLEELWRGQLDVELTQLDSLASQLADVERRLDLIANEDERIQRVRTIPGVGRKTAEVIVTALDDVDRFENGRQVSAYIGLVPRQYQSGETDRNGRITKRGSRLLRTMLVECAWLSLRYNEWSQTTYTTASTVASKLARRRRRLRWPARSRWSPGRC